MNIKYKIYMYKTVKNKNGIFKNIGINVESEDSSVSIPFNTQLEESEFLNKSADECLDYVFNKESSSFTRIVNKVKEESSSIEGMYYIPTFNNDGE